MSFLVKRSTKRVEKVIMPSPPSWIRHRIIIWPNLVKSLPVFNTISPVQEVAEVAVKNASIKLNSLFTREGPR